MPRQHLRRHPDHQTQRRPRPHHHRPRRQHRSRHRRHRLLHRRGRSGPWRWVRGCRRGRPACIRGRSGCSQLARRRWHRRTRGCRSLRACRPAGNPAVPDTRYLREVFAANRPPASRVSTIRHGVMGTKWSSRDGGWFWASGETPAFGDADPAFGDADPGGPGGGFPVGGAAAAGSGDDPDAADPPEIIPTTATVATPTTATPIRASTRAGIIERPPEPIPDPPGRRISYKTGPR